jgi:Uma2 family endonuclease
MSTTSIIERGVTIDQLADYPMDDGNRYELIDGELHVTTQPHLEHQRIVRKLSYALTGWDAHSSAGEVIIAPGVIFSERDAVAPDLVWLSNERAADVLTPDDGKLHGAPDLVVEVLSQGSANERRDREIKRELYDRYGVAEYWVVDRFARQVDVYRRQADALALVTQPDIDAELSSPLLPGFAGPVASLFTAADAP